MIATVTASVGVGSIAITGWTTGQSVAVGIAGGLITFYKVAGVGESTTVTATGTLATFMDIHIQEVDGIDNASPLDKVSSTVDSGSGVTSRSSGTTATTTQANEFVYVAVATVADNGAGASWTNSVTLENTTTHLITGDKSVTATGAYESTASWNTSQRAAGVVLTFFAETGDSYGLKIPLKPRIPVINWNNPITKGLLFDCPFFERGSTTTIDLIGDANGGGKPKGTMSGASWKTDLFGPVLNFTGGASVDQITFQITTLPSIISIECMFIVAAVDSTARRICSVTTTGNLIFISNVAPDGIKFQQTSTGGNGQWTTPEPSLNVWHHLLITYDSTSLANDPIIYIDNVVQSLTITRPLGSTTHSPGTFWVGNAQGANRAWNGKIGYFRYWNRLLNTVEVKQLYTNPWRIYSQPGILM